MPSVATCSDVPALLTALSASDPGRPRITWYGAGGERIELSAHVLANWVAKTSNLLVEDLDAEPGTTLLIDLPAHWRSAVWLLAGWSVGATVLVPSASHGADVTDIAVAADHPAPVSPGGHQVAVALASLATRHPALPDGAVDYAAVVAGFADVFLPDEDARGVALRGTGSDIGYDQLLTTARAAAAARGWQTGVRALHAATSVDPLQVWLAALSVDGSLVLVDAGAGLDLDHVAEVEQVTAQV